MQQFSAKLNVQLIAEIFAQSDILDIVISPGSRNGALTMQFTNDSRFNCYSIVDERSAAFVALGMAQSMQKPVVICCTSGSAAANYYPAITEAYYQNIPLIVLTADRPANYTDLFDGQTIRQENMYENHVYHSTQLLESEDEESLTENFSKIKKSLVAAFHNSGPVHINMPFSEPLYTSTQEKLINLDTINFPITAREKIDWTLLENEYYAGQKVMILVGLQYPDDALERLLQKISDFENIIVLTETTSNLHHNQFIAQIDAVLRNIKTSEIDLYKPDLLITLGQNVISKKIKQFLRDNPPKFHWHVDLHWHPDTYFSLTQKIKCNAQDFVYEFSKEFVSLDSDYRQNWLTKNSYNADLQQHFMQNIGWNDLHCFKNIIDNYPHNWAIHYSNSSVIRYSQLFLHHPSNPVYCNRGTSGIDGSTSTAIGFAMQHNKPVVLVTGDISFFYDSNALWNNYIPAHFRIILVNNGGGNIFKIIPGPDTTQALERFFETRHDLNALYLAKMFGFEYHQVNSMESLNDAWKDFYQKSTRPKILEIDTKNAPNAETLRAFITL